jgi:predicted transcriptional regulator of viral defense system
VEPPPIGWRLTLPPPDGRRFKRVESRRFCYFEYVTSLADVRPKDLPDYFLSHGRHWLTTAEIADALGGSLVDARQTANRWQAKGLAFSPTRGAYVLIPPEFRTWRAVPANHFVDDMMRYLGHSYYVGYLSAAEIHDAAHQRPQVFQVVTDERLKTRIFGRVRVKFILNTHTADRPTITVNTPTGTIRVSTPEATILDLVSAPEHSGGLSNIATIIGDLLEDAKINVSEIIGIAHEWPTTVIQRTGWLLEQAATERGIDLDLDPLAAFAAGQGGVTKLSPSGGTGPLNTRWNITVNTEVESDR